MDKRDVIKLKDVQEARTHLKDVVRKTPVEVSQGCSLRTNSQIFLKFENLQKTGSFKIRGAMNRIHAMTPAERKRGVIASSAGNHAQGVAYSASVLGVPSHVVMPTTAPMVKVEATQSYGAKVILHGSIYDEAYEHARLLEKEHEYVFVHPFEDNLIMAGQGTVGLEIFEDVKDFDSIVIPIGGGGLISGIATAIKELNPKCKIFGVQATGAHSMADSFREHKIVKGGAIVPSIADGIAVKNPSEFMFKNYISRLVDDVCTVTDDEIAEAIVFLLERAKSVVEGAGAASLAAAFSGRLKLGAKCCVLLSGGNIDLNIISRIIELGLRRHGRLLKLVISVDDKPGTLSRLTKILADEQVNVLQVYHDRSSSDLELMQTKIEFFVETKSEEHIQRVIEALKNQGCRILQG